MKNHKTPVKARKMVSQYDDARARLRKQRDKFLMKKHKLNTLPGFPNYWVLSSGIVVNSRTMEIMPTRVYQVKGVVAHRTVPWWSPRRTQRPQLEEDVEEDVLYKRYTIELFD